MAEDFRQCTLFSGHHRFECRHGVGISRRNIPLQEEEKQGNEHDDNTQGSSKITVIGDFPHKLVIQDNRECSVSFADQHRSTEVREHSHKNEQRGSEHGRKHEREDNTGYPLYVVCTEALGSFIQRVVEVFQCSADVHINQRERLQGEHKNNSGEAIDPFKVHAGKFVDDTGDNPFSPQQLNPGISPDEWRGEIAKDNCDIQCAAEADFILFGDIGDRQAESRADQRCNHSNFKRIL